MAGKAHARRYAQAAFEIALEKKELERWQDDLEKVAGTLADAAFLAALESPKIGLEDKFRLLSERLKGISPLVLNLARLLVTRGSAGMAGDIAAEYRRLLDGHRGIAPADVITAVPLDDGDRKKLAASLGSLVGKKVTLHAEVDPEILGGVIARVGGKLLDGSTRSRLAALKRELTGAERRR